MTTDIGLFESIRYEQRLADDVTERLNAALAPEYGWAGSVWAHDGSVRLSIVVIPVAVEGSM